MTQKKYLGIVANFHMARIDGDGVRYFEFALTVYPLPPGPQPPVEKVFYVNPSYPNAAGMAGQAFLSWSRQSLVEVVLHANFPRPKWVEDVRPVASEAGDYSSAPPGERAG